MDAFKVIEGDFEFLAYIIDEPITHLVVHPVMPENDDRVVKVFFATDTETSEVEYNIVPPENTNDNIDMWAGAIRAATVVMALMFGDEEESGG